MARRDEFVPDVVGQIQASASPGFTYGRSGTLPSSTWLLNDTVPSNISGRINFLNSASVIKIFVANETAVIVKLGIYTHDGNETGLTLIGTVTTAAARTNVFTVLFAVPVNKQVAVRVEPDSPSSGKNLDVGLTLQGTL